MADTSVAASSQPALIDEEKPSMGEAFDNTSGEDTDLADTTSSNTPSEDAAPESTKNADDDDEYDPNDPYGFGPDCIEVQNGYWNPNRRVDIPPEPEVYEPWSRSDFVWGRSRDNEIKVVDKFDENRIELLLNYHPHDNEPIQVRPGLFIGSIGAAANFPALRAAGITHVMNVAAELAPIYPATFGYTWDWERVKDRPDASILPTIYNSINFIDRAIDQGGCALVHCRIGKSRSAAVVLGYLMVRDKLSLEDAMITLKSVRPKAKPNSGFMDQLRLLEFHLIHQRQNVSEKS